MTSPLLVIRFALICFLSGAAALIFEGLWFRQAGLVLGNSVWASSLVLASFMTGLGLGNALMIRLGERAARPLRWYAVMEAAIGVTGAALVFFLPSLSPALAPVFRPVLDQPWVINPLRFTISWLLLVIPATAMGATLPLLVSGLIRQEPKFGAVLGQLYGWNTAGAVAGTLAGELLVGWLGVRGTALFAAGLNGLAGAAAVTAALTGRAKRAPKRRTARWVLTGPHAGLLAAAFLSGGILLALEVLWFRFLVFFVYGSSAAFAVMLAVVLSGIALGGLAGGWWMARRADAVDWLPAVAALNGLVCLGCYYAVAGALRTSSGQMAFLAPEILRLAVPLMLPVCALSGVLFTLTGEAVHRAVGGAVRVTGWVTLANTAGAALGSLAATLVFLPVFGLGRSIQVLAAGYGLAGAAALWAAPGTARRGQFVRMVAPVLLLAGAAASFPSGWLSQGYLTSRVKWLFRDQPDLRPVALREGINETVMYLRRDVLGEPLDYYLLTNGYVVSDSSFLAHRYTMYFAYLSKALHPEARRALLICFGAGGTAKALTTVGELESIDVVDISGDILDMSRLIFPDPREHPLNDPRVRVHVEDGRHFLQTTDRQYDLITGEPPLPKIAGVAMLYTQEYFELMRARLAPGGVVTYWLPVLTLSQADAKAIVQAFCGAFPDCSLWSGADTQWIMFGTRDGTMPVDAARLRSLWDDPHAGPRLRALGYEVPEQLLATYLGDAEFLREWMGQTPPLTDNWPKRLSVAHGWPAWVHMDVDAIRGRFVRSGYMARLLPEALRDETVPYFDTQKLVNRAIVHSEFPERFHDLPAAHQLLTETTLRELPLWYLGSNAYPQQIARTLQSQGVRHPWVEHQLGLQALAGRQYGDAADHFRAAMELGGAERRLWHYRLYALCMAGRPEEAEQLAALHAARHSVEPEDAAVYGWLADTWPGTRWPAARPALDSAPEQD